MRREIMRTSEFLREKAEIKAEEKTINLMFEALDFAKETEKAVREKIGRIGMVTFFNNIDYIEVADEVKEKINALKDIMKITGITGNTANAVVKGRLKSTKEEATDNE
ncbi:MAG: hypothetical protein ACLKAK_11840 [Alkaliphilus sp.]